MLTATFFLALLAVASAKPSVRMVHHEGREAAPRGYTQVAPAASSKEIKLRIALAQNNMPGLIKALYDVSTPSSASYGDHLSKEEVEKFVAPSAETVKTVNEWLESHGIVAKADTPAGDWLSFTVPVEKASEMFGADFHVYKHTAGREIIRTLSYSVPSHLKGHVELMYPGISFPSGSNQKVVLSAPIKAEAESHGLVSDAGNAIPSSCARSVTPACLQAQYGIPTTAATQKTNAIGVSGYDEQYANKKDLTSFLTKYRPDMSSATTFTLQTIDGGSNSQTLSQAGVEADLDIQYTVGIATGVPTYFISVGEQNQDGDLEGFLDTVNFLLGESAPPQVLTTSYGPNENDVSRALTNNICNAWAQIGARGTSVLFASGDGGVSGTQSSSCSKFVVPFPCGCPYVTIVGGTTGIAPETGAGLSSGGFSNYFPTASFQTSQVKAYLTSIGTQYSGKYNASGRGFPDVAAQAESVAIYNEGSATPVDGTSCSSPIFASVVGLLNDLLIKAGKSPLGWMNPFIYANPQAFNDITSGNNPGCNTNGFSASKGWDPVTGMGSPNFAALRTAAGV